MQDSSVSVDVDENVAVLAIFGVFAAVDESTALQHAFVKRGVKVDVALRKAVQLHGGLPRAHAAAAERDRSRWVKIGRRTISVREIKT